MSRKWRSVESVRQLVRAGVIALILLVGSTTRPAWAQSLCETCDLMVGVGGTYHYWGATGGVVVPITLSLDNNRYEFGFFRVTTQQTLVYRRQQYARVLAQPYGGVSVSRRWQIVEVGPVRAFVGFGLAVKSESDVLSVTRWDFASQVGVRFPFPLSGNRALGELTMRHWSNAGVRLPNHGEDFTTFTVRINPDLPGVPRTDQISIDPRLIREYSRAASGFGPGQALP
jgi:Lipid A 3-O-deacylase (PagL)